MRHCAVVFNRNTPPQRWGKHRSITDLRTVRCRAFTLIETVIAMALLTLIIIGAFSLLIGSYATMRRTQETLYVNRLLESAIEMTRHLSFEELKTQAANSPVELETGSSLVPLYEKVNESVDDTGYTMELQDASGQIVFDPINPNLYRVTVSVTYTPFRLGPRTSKVATYISSNGVNRR